jgi:hypothetical protein
MVGHCAPRPPPPCQSLFLFSPPHKPKFLLTKTYLLCPFIGGLNLFLIYLIFVLCHLFVSVCQQFVFVCVIYLFLFVNNCFCLCYLCMSFSIFFFYSSCIFLSLTGYIVTAGRIVCGDNTAPGTTESV